MAPDVLQMAVPLHELVKVPVVHTIAGIALPECLLVPLYVGGEMPLGTLWIVSPSEGHFDSGHARIMTELAAFAGMALRAHGSHRGAAPAGFR